jgi:hypothetical protein
MDLLLLTMTDKWQTRPLVREGVPYKTGQQLSKKNQYLVMSPVQTDWLAVSRNVTQTQNLVLKHQQSVYGMFWDERPNFTFIVHNKIKIVVIYTWISTFLDVSGEI